MRVTGACDCFCYGLVTAQAIASAAILFGSSMIFLSLAKIGLISVIRLRNQTRDLSGRV
jgi:hypothetical protein